MNFAQYVGARFRRFRVEKKLTQRVAAERARVFRPNLIRFERGLVDPTGSTLVRFAGAVDVTVSELVRGFEAQLSEEGSDRPVYPPHAGARPGSPREAEAS